MTTVTSPAKPKMITIPRRRSATVPAKTTSPRTKRHIASLSLPLTPPHSPQSSARESSSPPSSIPMVNTQQDPLAKANQFTYPMTPPSSRASTPYPFSTRSRGNSVSSANSHLSQLDQAVPASHVPEKAVMGMLDEIEASIASFPNTKLLLDSPLIEGVRQRTLEYKRCRKSPCSKPYHSRFSIFNPLASHPTSPRTPVLTSSPPVSSPTSKFSHTTLRTLRAIFPAARPHQLDSLFATYLAFNYTRTLQLNPPALPSIIHRSPLAENPLINPAQSPLTPCAEPAPRPALEIAPSPHVKSSSDITPPPDDSSSNPPSPQTSWLRPPTPDSEQRTQRPPIDHHEDPGAEAAEPKQSILDRTRSVKRGLYGMLRTLVEEIEGEEIEGREMGEWDEVVVRAVGEVVRVEGGGI